jgi:hypothetical protein
MARGTAMKVNDNDGWSSDCVVLWLGKRQNGDAVERWGEWAMLKWHFYSSGWRESGCLGRVANGGGVDSILQFRLEGRWWYATLLKDEAELASSSWLYGEEAWHDVVAWWHRPEERQHLGGEREETTLVGLTRILLGRKMKKIYVVDSVATNGRWKF